MSHQNGPTQASGFLNLYKPPGITSMDLVRQVKRLTGQRKRVGHGGTLDPLAEGVLPIFLGQATRLMEYLVDSIKAYRMTVYLGASTETYDAEGEVVRQGDTSQLTEEGILRAVEGFQGTILQTPPMYSAIKRQGRRLYDLARSGVVVEREPRKVHIERLQLLRFDPPFIELDVECGRGVYLRSLSHDLGEALGCGAHLRSLVRLRSGPFTVEGGLSVDTLRDVTSQGSWQDLLLPVDFVVLNMKSTSLSKIGEKYVRNGQSVNIPREQVIDASYLESYRVYTEEGHFLAILRFDKARDRWLPYKVFNLSTPSPYAPRYVSDM